MQKQQYLKRTGGLKFPVKNGDTSAAKHAAKKHQRGTKWRTNRLGHIQQKKSIWRREHANYVREVANYFRDKLILKIFNCIERSPHHRHLKMILYNNPPHQHLNWVEKLYKNPIHNKPSSPSNPV